MTKQAPRILLTNAHSVANAGDYVLLTVSIDELRRVFPDSAITVAMGDPAPIPGYPDVTIVPSLTTRFKHGAPHSRSWNLVALAFLPITAIRLLLFLALYRLTGNARSSLLPASWRPLLDVYTSADLVVSSAGNFLYASGRLSLPLMLQFGAIFLALWLGKPTYTMPQTVGPFAKAGVAGCWQQSALRALATNLRIFQLRDEPSRVLIRGVRAPLARTVVSPDVALLFGARSIAPRLDNHPPRLGATLINWGAQNSRFAAQADYEAAVAQACAWFIQKQGGEVHLFAQVTGPHPADDDRVPARRVAAFIAQKLPAAASLLHLHDTTYGADLLQQHYGSMDIVLGSRLHSTLFAMVVGTPVAAIAYQPKTRGVFATLGLEEWALPIEEAVGEAVQVLAAGLWAQRCEVAAHIAAAMPQAQRNAAAAAERIADDFARVSG